MTDSAIALLRERGAAGVTIEAVLARSGAPRGSVYHHFPGGRDEIVLAAAHSAGDSISAFISETIASGGSSRAIIRGFVDYWKSQVQGEGFTAGCAIVALTLDDRPDLPAARALSEQIFADWHRMLAAQLKREGHSRAECRRLATSCVAAIEGAIILSRASRSTQPLDDVATTLAALLKPA